MTINHFLKYNDIATIALKTFKCASCNAEKSFIVKVKQDLICISCRYINVGKDTIWEALYNGMD